jgi:hypothetical protein
LSAKRPLRVAVLAPKPPNRGVDVSSAERLGSYPKRRTERLCLTIADKWGYIVVSYPYKKTNVLILKPGF